MTYATQMRMNVREASQAFTIADDLWFLELECRFGRDAAQARYEPRGRGSFGDKLGDLFLAFDKARRAYEAARDARDAS